MKISKQRLARMGRKLMIGETEWRWTASAIGTVCMRSENGEKAIASSDDIKGFVPGTFLRGRHEKSMDCEIKPSDVARYITTKILHQEYTEPKDNDNDVSKCFVLAPTPCLEPKPYISVTFKCDNCGEFDVIKSHGSLNQRCFSCGSIATPLKLLQVTVKTDREYQSYNFEN